MDTCRKCGGPLKPGEKDTSSGRDIREYICIGCGFADWEDRGVALWKLLHDDRNEMGPELAATPIPQPLVSAAPASRWNRFLACLRLRRM